MDNRSQAQVLPEGARKRIQQEAMACRDDMVAFLQRLIQTPSLPGEEGAVAEIVAEEMRKVGYDEVQIDHAGNTVGKISATQKQPRGRVMLNTHMDHVDVGDHSRWPFPPYSGTLQDGYVWGRGTSDLKGPLAAQVYAGAVLKRSGLELPNDLYVVGVVQEEVGGLGSAELSGTLQVDYIVIGEPSANCIALGHRGRTEIVVTITGKSVHASVPELGVNPLYSMGRFLSALEKLSYEKDPDFPDLGPTTVAPTLIRTDQTSPNVVPSECKLTLDFRNTPLDSPEKLLVKVRELLDAALQGEAQGKAEIEPKHLVSYTGVKHTVSNAAPAFGVVAGSTFLPAAKAGIEEALGREVSTKIWPFATDAGHFVAPGVEIIGFGPGHEEVIHTVDERISVDEMVEAVIANAAIALSA